MTPEDAEILSEAIIAADERADEAADAFRAMLERGAALTPKQRAWAVGVATGKFVDAEPEYENLVSSGRVPRGREVETPAVLRVLPLRPPGRR